MIWHLLSIPPYNSSCHGSIRLPTQASSSIQFILYFTDICSSFHTQSTPPTAKGNAACVEGLYFGTCRSPVASCCYRYPWRLPRFSWRLPQDHQTQDKAPKGSCSPCHIDFQCERAEFYCCGANRILLPPVLCILLTSLINISLNKYIPACNTPHPLPK